MKTFIPPSMRILAAGVLVVAGSAVSSATTVVFSNLVPDNVGSASLLIDSRGTPLDAGCWVRLGDFGALSQAEIQALAQQSHQALITAFNPFGPAFSLGSGTESFAGRVEFAASVLLSESRGGLHAVVFNSPSPAASTEVLVAALPGVAPPDDASGLAGYLAVHLNDATLVFGSATANGSATAAPVSSFQSWMEGQITGDVPAEDLLPNGDLDGDGLLNLLEYGLGSQAGDASSRLELETTREESFLRLRFLRRTDDPDLEVVLETSTRLEAAVWEISTATPQEVTVPRYPAPAGFVWVQLDLPMTGERLFARLRATQGP